MSIEFESPAARIIKQFDKGESEFRIPADLPDLTFIRRLSIQGRLRYFNAQSTQSEDIITITPPTGETFFFLKAIFINAHTAQANMTITNAGIQRALILLEEGVSGNVAAPTVYYDHLDSLVGNGTDSMIFNANQTLVRAIVMGWVENTSRIRDSAI